MEKIRKVWKQLYMSQFQIDGLESYCQGMAEGQYEASTVEELVALRLCPAYIVPQVKHKKPILVFSCCQVALFLYPEATL